MYNLFFKKILHMDYICPLRNRLESQIKSLPEYLKIQNENQVKQI